MLLSNEYTLIPHVKVLLKYDNNVESSVILKTDDIITCQYKEQDKTSTITGKIGNIGYKLNSSLTAVERSIYLQIDGSKEYDGKVVYVNIDDIVGIKVIKTGSMISNPVCTVSNDDQSIALIRENQDGKMEYSKDGVEWKIVSSGEGLKKKDNHDDPSNTDTGEDENSEITEGNINDLILNSKTILDIKKDIASLNDKLEKIPVTYKLEELSGLKDIVDGLKIKVEKLPASVDIAEDKAFKELKSSLEELQGKVNTLVASKNTVLGENTETGNTEIDAIKLKINQIETKISAITPQENIDIPGLKRSIDTATENITALGNKITTLTNGDVKTNKDDIISLKSKDEDLNSKITKLQEKDVELETKLKNVVSSDTVSGLQNNVNTINQSITALQQKDIELDNKITTLTTGDVKNTKDTIAILQGTIGDIESKVKVITDTHIKNLTDNIASLQTKDTTLEEKITTLQNGDVKTNKDDIISLKAKDENLDSEIRKLQEKDVELNGKIVSLTNGEVKTNKDDIAALKAKDIELGQSITTLQQKDVDLDGKISNLTNGDVKTSKDNIAILQTKVQTLEDKIVAPESAVKKEEFDEFKDAIDKFIHFEKRIDVSVGQLSGETSVEFILPTFKSFVSLNVAFNVAFISLLGSNTTEQKYNFNTIVETDSGVKLASVSMVWTRDSIQGIPITIPVNVLKGVTKIIIKFNIISGKPFIKAMSDLTGLTSSIDIIGFGV